MQLRVFFYPGVRRRKEVGGLAAIRGLGGGERSPSHSRCRGKGALLCAPHHVKIHGGCQQDNGLETISSALSGCRHQT